jgi:hypothetical protein
MSVVIYSELKLHFLTLTIWHPPLLDISVTSPVTWPVINTHKMDGRKRCEAADWNRRAVDGYQRRAVGKAAMSPPLIQKMDNFFEISGTANF